jgi:Ca2+-transporting ATPase
MFTTLAWLQVCQAFATRSSTEPFWRVGFFSNRALVLTATAVVALQIGVLYSPVGPLMGLRPLGWADMLVCASLGAIPFAGIEAEKAWRRRRVSRG